MSNPITYKGMNEKGMIYELEDFQLIFEPGSRKLIKAYELTQEDPIEIQNREVTPHILDYVRAYHVRNSLTRGLKMNI